MASGSWMHRSVCNAPGRGRGHGALEMVRVVVVKPGGEDVSGGCARARWWWCAVQWRASATASAFLHYGDVVERRTREEETRRLRASLFPGTYLYGRVLLRGGRRMCARAGQSAAYWVVECRVRCGDAARCRRRGALGARATGVRGLRRGRCRARGERRGSEALRVRASRLKVRGRRCVGCEARGVQAELIESRVGRGGFGARTRTEAHAQLRPCTALEAHRRLRAPQSRTDRYGVHSARILRARMFPFSEP
ncbi:hypothetical protein DFH09DRAFT_1076710 [Mycena vulgaris]|nr:hypothetical protein DFH09DRAFT_1076710 [Mycena vulgaris]